MTWQWNCFPPECAKLVIERSHGRDGWKTCSVDDLADQLVAHLPKGDPVDIANFCMMLSVLGEHGNGGAITRALSRVSGDHTLESLARLWRP